MVYEYFLEGQFITGYAIYTEEQRPDLIGGPELPQDIIDNGCTDEYANYKYKKVNNEIIATNNSDKKNEYLNKLIIYAIELLNNSLILDRINGNNDLSTQAITFLSNKKSEIQNASDFETIETIQTQIHTKLQESIDQIIQEL